MSTPARPRLALALELGGGAHPTSPHTTARPLHAWAALAEEAGYTLLTLADSPLGPGPEAGVAAAHLALTSDRIGLAPTLHATTTEPFHLATQLASLDHASHGRGAWIVAATNSATDLATIGRTPLTEEALHRETRDVIETARALWDSWEDDAVVKSTATSRFLDPDKVHHVDFEGDGFTVKGPLITPRPPQGQLVVIAPAELDVDVQADVVLVGADGYAERAARARAAGAALVFAEIEVLLDTDTPATRRLDHLDRTAGWPDSGRFRHVGSVAQLVQLLQQLSTVVDGVRLHPAEPALDLPVLTQQLTPALTLAGLHRAPEPGATLRESLGLPRPANRFAAVNPAVPSRA